MDWGGFFSSPFQKGGSERVGAYCCTLAGHQSGCASAIPRSFPLSHKLLFLSPALCGGSWGVRWRVCTYWKAGPAQHAQDLAEQRQEERRGTRYTHVFFLYVLWINSWSLSHLGNWKQLAYHFCSSALKTLYCLSAALVWCVTSYSRLSLAPHHLRALWTPLSFLAASPLWCLLSLMSPLTLFICIYSFPVDLSRQNWIRGAAMGQKSCLGSTTESTDTWDKVQQRSGMKCMPGPSPLRNLAQWTETRTWERGCNSEEPWVLLHQGIQECRLVSGFNLHLLIPLTVLTCSANVCITVHMISWEWREEVLAVELGLWASRILAGHSVQVTLSQGVTLAMIMQEANEILLPLPRGPADHFPFLAPKISQ